MKKSMLRAAVAAAALVAASQAQAATFLLNSSINTSTVNGSKALQGFQIAAAYWSSVLTDNVTVNLNIGFRTLGTGVLAQAGSTSTLLSINQTRNLLTADRTSGLDALAVANLVPNSGVGLNTPTGPTGAISFTANAFANGTNGAGGYTDTATRVDADGSINNVALAVTKASAKAMGATRDVNGALINYSSSDASVTFSDAFEFDFDPTDGIDANAFDFIGVAIHEIGHTLGFISGVDTYDAFTAPGATDPIVRNAQGQPIATGLEGFVVGSQLDLFRYSSANTLDWSTQNTPYFSIDRGQSQLFGDSRFSTGVLNGDARQASHWKDSVRADPQLGVMDPTSGRGQLQEVTALDLAAFDAIGWNTSFDVLQNSGYRYTTASAFAAFAAANPAVPEPGTWALMIAGFGFVGGSMRAQRRRTTVAFAA
jgi:hypothetical protein